ncbi:MAG: hypothetical protein OEY67_06965, partial [Gammaproteobacteria bacterium]|nr:hypothetical protein [Gammaproteobacteria bacterium]
LQWFFRRADGSGVAVSPLSGKPVMGAGIVSLEDFPGLLLRRDWVDSQMTNIIQEFISWQAPWLLLLQGISDDIRNELEKFACKYSRRLALNQRLYPKVINQDSIRAALVEARLRVANEISDILQPAINDPSHQIAGQYY